VFSFFHLELSVEQDKESSSIALAPTTRTERAFNSQLSLKSSSDENGGSSDSHRGSVTSLNSVDGPARTENRKSKLALPRVLRKHSKDDDGERTSSKFEKSPRLLRKTTSGQSANSKDNASTEGSEQDIDAMFKDYEQSEHSKNKSPGQKEFTGWFFVILWNCEEVGLIGL